MTSRESTQWRARAHADEAHFERDAQDWIALLGIGAIQWPWLLRSLRGGTQAQKQALLERLDLPHDALPNLGGWKADTSLLHKIADRILTTKPRLVVEFGVGASTLIAARALQMNGSGRMISFDQHADFVISTREWLADHGLSSDLRIVSLIASSSGWPGLWYDHRQLPDGIDLLLIDGPCWTIHPFGRGAAESLFNKIAVGGMLMLDDGERPGERVIRRLWAKRHPNFDFKLVREGTKGTVIGIRRR